MAHPATLPPTARTRAPVSDQLHFTQKELRNAFRQFSNISQGEEKSKKKSIQISENFLLYSIYAVECGLKAIILEDIRVKTTEKLPKKYRNHDINALLGAVNSVKRSPRLNRMNRLPQMSRMRSGGEREIIPPGRLHELYRYGGQLDSESQDILIHNLSALFEKIGHKLKIRVQPEGGQ